MDGATLPCVVTLRGPSVIEGLKELVKVGAAELPLPPFLANLHSLARSTLTVGAEEEEEEEKEEEERERGPAASAAGTHK